MQVDGLIHEELGTDRGKGQDHHGEVARTDVEGRHGDDVHDDGDGEASDDERVHDTLAVGVKHEGVVDETSENVRGRCEKQADAGPALTMAQCTMPCFLTSGA